jgi:hypothetical protein
VTFRNESLSPSRSGLGRFIFRHDLTIENVEESKENHISPPCLDNLLYIFVARLASQYVQSGPATWHRRFRVRPHWRFGLADSIIIVDVAFQETKGTGKEFPAIVVLDIPRVVII